MRTIDEHSQHPFIKKYYPYPYLNEHATSGTSFGLVIYDSRTDLVKTLRDDRDKWRPPTPYERHVRTGRLDGIEVDLAYHARGSDGLLKEAGSYLGNMEWPVSWRPSMPVFPEELYGRAVNKALNKLKDQKVNLAVAFGERKETAEFVSSTLKTGADLARAIRKKDIRGVKRALSVQERKKRPFNQSTPEVFKEVSDAPSKLILTNSYAFQPLLSDVHGVLEEFNRRDNDKPFRYKTKAVAQAGCEILDFTSQWLSPVGNAEFEFIRTTQGFHSAKVRLDYYLDNPFLKTLSQLGITNPVSLGWDLLPLSFVVDWFLPVGSYLSALDAHLGLSFRGGSVSLLTRSTVKSEVYRVRHWQYGNTIPIRKKTNSPPAKQNRLIRQIFGQSPGPVYPGFKNPWSNKHVSDALALLAQAVQGNSLHYR